MLVVSTAATVGATQWRSRQRCGTWRVLAAAALGRRLRCWRATRVPV